jgi:isopentenyldiphosphate isomerase
MKMKEERFDVVNERNEVIGYASRAEVHRQGLRHRAVHILVFNRFGQVFLQRRSMLKDCSPGLWDSSASGHLDRGEDYEACAVRELHEELGWSTASALECWFELAACADTGQEFVRVFRTQADGPFHLHPDEILEGAWFDVDAVSAWVRSRPEDFASAFRLVWLEASRRALAAS